MTDIQNQIPQSDDPEAATKAAWLAQSQAEVAPQVEADPLGVAAAAAEGTHMHEISPAGDVTHYHAIISAHFPDEASAMRALEAVKSSPLADGSYHNLYHAGDPKIETEIGPGEMIMMLQLDLGEGAGEGGHEELVRMITEAGGTKVNYTPPQSLINTGFNEH